MLFIETRGNAGINSDNRISNSIYQKRKSCKNSSYLVVRREETDIILKFQKLLKNYFVFNIKYNIDHRLEIKTKLCYFVVK